VEPRPLFGSSADLLLDLARDALRDRDRIGVAAFEGLEEHRVLHAVREALDHRGHSQRSGAYR